MNEQNEKWNEFKQTGKIEDYLKYIETKTTDSLWKDV